jgi:hypothetical protein
MGVDLFGTPLGGLGMFSALKNAGTGTYGQFGEVFAKTLRFGMIDNGIVVLSGFAGNRLEDKIAKLTGIKGIGTILGAAVGNAISDGVAGLPEGKEAAKGYFFGALLPIAPLGAAIIYAKAKGQKGDLSKETKMMVGGLTAAMIAFAVFRRSRNRKAVNPQAAAPPPPSPTT